MSSKSKAKAKSPAAAGANSVDEATAKLATTSIAPAATEADEADSGDEPETSGGKKAADKKKDKKKAAKKKEEPKISAAGQAILLRKQQQEAEDARIRKLQQEEEERIRQEEEKERLEKEAIEAEKERKRKAKQDKLEKQKESGTYMTKGEKERQKKLQARLDAMKAAGGLIVPGSAAAIAESQKLAEAKAAREAKEAQKLAEAQKRESEEEEAFSKKSAVAAPAPAPAAASAEEDDAGDDDWESADWESNVDKITAKVESLVEQARNDEEDAVEDLIVLEKKAENEKLRALGLERARREEEARQRREEEEREREQMEQRAFEELMRKETAKKNRLAREVANRNARTPANLRSPICCIMGHVDTGKTKLLDKIRHTNVQEGEAGGITQQIGATKFPRETLQAQTAGMLNFYPSWNIRLPGLLVIDTPGHESFSNLRNRGSSLCDIAILVIDLMHGLEQQTIESLNMLLQKNSPFVVALNKVDRCYGWKTCPDAPIREALAVQDENCKLEFEDRSQRIMVQLAEKGVNSKLYWDMKPEDAKDNYIPLVPTSAISGEGVPDLLWNLVNKTQDEQTEKMMYCENLQCTVLEVKVLEGLGHTVDVVLVNGTLKEGDTIVVSTMEGPMVTNIRALLTPPPNREMRVRSEYEHHQTLSGSIGVKIVAPDISRAIAGTPIMLVQEGDDLDDVKEECQADLKSVTTLETDEKGVIVHASTLGALEALLHFLRVETKPKIPVIHVTIGPIHKKDVMRAGIMHDRGCPEYATILAFDVKIDAEAQEMANETNVRIFTADIIYHLFDQFTAYMNGIITARKEAAMAIAVHPCVLKILPNFIFNKKDPIVLGVEVLEGTLKLGTPLYIPSLSLDVGKVTRIENNHKEAQLAKKGTSVSVQITNEGNPTITYGRQFDHTNSLYSKISRQSIDALKEFFKEDVSKEDWGLMVKLKKVFNIP